MNEHKYILESYKGMSTRYRCPGCNHREKTFSRYIDTQTGEHLHPSVGRCNREINCGYHYTPKQYFQDNNFSFDKSPFSFSTPLKSRKHETPPKPHPVSLIPIEVFKQSLQQHTESNFVKFLYGLFGKEITLQLIERYFIGTSKHWNGAVVFWQIAEDGIRTGKIMQYNSDTGKRVKDKINWVHSVLKIENFNLKQCFFGQHLLKDKTNAVAIVESEKTAVIASVYLPGFIWLAVGSLTNLSTEKCKALQGRTVTLFPDLNGFDKWSSKAKELSHLAIFTVSDLLERKATEAEREQGLDLADYLIRLDYRAFQQQVQPETQRSAPEPPQQTELATAQELQPVGEMYLAVRQVGFTEPEPMKLKSWTDQIMELENYFATASLPLVPVKLNQCSTITNVFLFIESHFATVKANNGKRTFLPYLERLQELKKCLGIKSAIKNY